MIDDEDGSGGYSVKSSFGRYLAAVPALWFHGTFAAMILMLLVLGTGTAF